jgi:hypothetical protein
MERESKFVQLVANDGLLTALDEDGDVWTYIGNAYGWRPMNMTRLSDKTAGRMMKSKYKSSYRSPRLRDDDDD